MDLFELQDFVKASFPEKEATYSFPVESHRCYEIMMTDGKPNPQHHLECRKVLVKIDGEPDKYYPIKPHRMCLTTEQIILALQENVIKNAS